MEESSDQESSGPRKRRRAITDAQRKDLRVHKQILMQKNNKWSMKEMIEFFDKNYDRVLSKSVISDILSDKFNHLDDEDHPPEPETKRRYGAKWPDLEAALFEWHQRTLKEKGTIMDKDLREMARKIFDRLPQYHNLEPPSFTNHWLETYKERYKVSDFDRNRESDGMGLQAVSTRFETRFETFSETLKTFEREEIYNMDETALFWKMSPDNTPVSGGKAGSKLEKAQITVILACNATGTHRLPPWVIGKAHTPRCFDSAGVHMKNLPIIWRYNGNAMMTAVLFEEYLRWFDGQMGGRKMCLLIDKLFAHMTGMELLYLDSPEGLDNIRIMFFPAATASVHQPLDQGVIRSWKVHYRERWLEYMCDEYDAGRNPIETMNILHAVRWVIAAWYHDVTPTTVQNSWIKSGALGPDYASRIEGWQHYVYEDNRVFTETTTRMAQQIKSLAQQRYLKSAMDVNAFVSPANETVEDDDEDHFESLLEAYSTGGAMREYETDEEDFAEDLIEEGEALELLERLRLYEEQQEDGDKVVLARLNEYERDIRARLLL